MEDRGKTIMCSVLFLDIVEYSKKSVSGQISLKERFNAYLSVAIRDVPIDDRIILDTGDGAALSFLGDVEDALQVALSMRESLREGMHMEPPLLVRMGINLGPVRLVKDINGQPNIVGDGINVAQRVMGFADPGQILVSRPYFDAVSRLSSEYAGMFHYQGSRTDKHVREHEIYAIGYPGEFTSTLTMSRSTAKSHGELTALSKHLSKSWQAAAVTFQKASPLKRVIYATALIAPIVAVIAVVVALALILGRPTPVAVQPAGAPIPAQVIVASQVAAPTSAVVATLPASAVVAPIAPSLGAPKATEQGEVAQAPKKPTKKKPAGKKAGKTPKAPAGEGGRPTLLVSCTPGTSVFVDGLPKGKIEKGPLAIRLDPGKHLIMMIHPTKSQVRSKDIRLTAGQTFKLSPPDFCK
jgi:hypothetical protein